MMLILCIAYCHYINFVVYVACLHNSHCIKSQNIQENIFRITSVRVMESRCSQMQVYKIATVHSLSWRYQPHTFNFQDTDDLDVYHKVGTVSNLGQR